MNAPPPVVPSTRSRAMIVALIAAVAAVATMLAGVVPATAATGSPSPASRFWGYYQLTDGQWSFATTGPDEAKPADGAVEGWRFAVATMEAPRYPRAQPAFEQICAQTPAKQGSKRVGVLIDYGRPADSAQGSTPPQARAACAVVPTEATGTDVLAAVAQHRMEGGMLCGLDGYPATGCFEQVGEPSAEAAAADEPVEAVIGESQASSTTTAAQSADAQQPGQSQPIGAATWVIVGVFIVLAAAAALALTLLRRRRQP